MHIYDTSLKLNHYIFHFAENSIFVIWAEIWNAICDIYDISNDVNNEIWSLDICYDI